MDHSIYLNLTLQECTQALNINEVPIACIFLRNGEIIAKAHNLTNIQKNPLAHAELVCLKTLVNYKNLICYVNVEPCGMCMDILRRYDIEVYYSCKNYIFGGNTVFEMGYGTYVSDNGRSVELLKMFYEQENDNAPKEIRKNKEKKRLKKNAFGVDS